MDYVNKSLSEINLKQQDLTNLIEKIENFIKENSEKPQKIESVRKFFHKNFKFKILEFYF